VERADVVIVGGGIVGSAVAYFLSSERAFKGRRIVLVERDPSYARCSTARAVGGLRQQFSTPENIAMSRFTLELIRRLEDTFGPYADVAFREQGYLIMAGPEGAAVLAENVALQRSNGADIVLLDASALAQRFAWLATEGIAAGAFGHSGEGWFDPPSLADLMRKAARAQGVTILHGEVAAIEIAGRGVKAVSIADGGRIDCGAVVNAAGAWAGALAALAGLRLPIEPRKRYVYVID
jgi:glycine/D-amino acid oxidase-like deaminating enzyme